MIHSFLALSQNKSAQIRWQYLLSSCWSDVCFVEGIGQTLPRHSLLKPRRLKALRSLTMDLSPLAFTEVY